MAQEDTLLAAVRQDPEDDAPRLVYADWLEEHGDPARAEYIRLQCRLAERERDVDPTFPDPDWEREMELERANHDRWAAELPTLPGVYFSFGDAFRGFPAVAARNPDGLARHADRILAATPIEAV